MLIRDAHKIGIEVRFSDLEPEEYKNFLDERRPIVAEQLRKIEEEISQRLNRVV